MRTKTKRLTVEIFSVVDDTAFKINGDLSDDTQLDVTLNATMSVSPKRNRAQLVVKNLATRTQQALAGTIVSTFDYSNDSTYIYSESGEGSNITEIQGAQLFPDGINREETVNTGNAFVTIDAGEDSNIGRIFEGSCQDIRHSFGGQSGSGDVFTTLVIADGLTTGTGAVHAQEFDPGTELFDVVQFVVRNMGLKPGNLSRDTLNKAIGANVGSNFPRGFTTLGNSDWLLTSLFAFTNAEWFIDRGEFFVVPKGQPVQSNVTSVLNRDNGLHSRPEPLDGGAVMVRFDHRNDIRLGRELIIDSAIQLSGTYRVEQLNYSLNNREGVWLDTALLRMPQTIPGVF